MTYRFSFILPAFVALWLCLEPQAWADEIKPPFGLHWGETVTRMERLLAGAHATVTERKKVDGRDAWEVDGIVSNQLEKTVFYFSHDALVEVELRYRTTDWDAEKYDSFMGEVRQKLAKQFGEPELIARREEPVGDVIQKVVGWKWNRNNTSIELFYFSAQNAAQVFRSLSVHYKAN